MFFVCLNERQVQCVNNTSVQTTTQQPGSFKGSDHCTVSGHLGEGMYASLAVPCNKSTEFNLLSAMFLVPKLR
jgi:hypothetical protein